MRSAENFKVGFLRKLAEAGLTPSDIEAAMVKQASVDINPTAAIGPILKNLWILGVGGPLAVGALTGAIARSATQADDEDPSEIKNREMTAVYRQLTQDARERMERAKRQRQPARRRDIAALGSF